MPWILAKADRVFGIHTIQDAVRDLESLNCYSNCFTADVLSESFCGMDKDLFHQNTSEFNSI